MITMDSLRRTDTAVVPSALPRESREAHHPRIVGLATALPAHNYSQQTVCEVICRRTFGEDWATRADVAEQVNWVRRLFASTGVEHRQVAIDAIPYYSVEHTTGERMRDYEQLSLPLARDALVAALAQAQQPAEALTDLIFVSCTGYTTPGIDILLARDLGMRPSVRRIVLGHVGCHGAVVGMRTALSFLRAQPESVVAVVAVELSSLHFSPRMKRDYLTAAALFGDASAAVVLSADGAAQGPELVDFYCVSDFSTADHMTWKITDYGFVMGLSPRIPVTIRRNVVKVVSDLLGPHGLTPDDVAHWVVHAGGPDILEVVTNELELTAEQMAPTRQVLREHGNCSSATVLLILEELLRSGRPQSGEWGVLMAFGPGLTLEMSLLRF